MSSEEKNGEHSEEDKDEAELEDNENELSPEEQLLKKHKKEKRELQAKIQKLKKTVNKADKKRKKELHDEITKIEADLAKKQQAELESLSKNQSELQSTNENAEEEDLADSLEKAEVNEKRVSKAQRRRNKKANVQKEREKLILEQEVENKSSTRNLENEKIKQILKELGLMIYEIEADGNCLYNAIDHQLKLKTEMNYGTKQLRLETSNHIKNHSSEYLPFLSNVNTGEMLTDEEFEEYCRKVAHTTNWGGQVELRALSHVVKRSITVIQADSPPLIMGEEYKDKEGLIVAYHRHKYRLGEHYNSVQPYVEDEF